MTFSLRGKGKWVLAIVAFVAMLGFWINYDFTTKQVPPEQIAAQETIATTQREQLSGSGNERVDFFIEYKIERDRTRGQQMEIFRELINNKDADPEVRKNAQRSLLQISQNMEKEMKVENLIKAKGFADAVIFIDADTAQVVVRTAKLEDAQAAQIADIVNRSTGIALEKIAIIAKK